MSVARPEMLPLVDSMIGFMEEAMLVEKTAQERLAALQQRCQVLEAEKVTLEKVAATAVRLEASKVRFMLNKLASMGIVDNRSSDDLELRFREDPNTLVPFIIKLAETLAPASDQGRGVAPEQTPAETDPDGWQAALSGRVVAVRRT